MLLNPGLVLKLVVQYSIQNSNANAACNIVVDGAMIVQFSTET